MTYNSSNLSTAANTGVVRHPSAEINSLLKDWQLLGRVRTNFIDQLKGFQHCPADIFYNVYNPDAQRFAEDFGKALSDARWNVTIGPLSRPTEGIKIVSKSSTLHAEEIGVVVKWFRKAGIDAKVRVRGELDTEAIQIEFGSVPKFMQGS